MFNAVLVKKSYISRDMLDPKHESEIYSLHKLENKDLFSQFRKLIECDMIEHVSLKIGKKVFHLWLDEEGKLKENLPCFLCKEYRDIFVGNVIFTRGASTLKPITDEEIQMIKDYVNDGRYRLLNVALQQYAI